MEGHPLFQRLLPVELLKHHWTSLTDRSAGRGSRARDWPVTAVLVVVPVGSAVWMWLRGVELQAPAALLSALSLLSAGLLASFAQIAVIRSRYRLPDDDYDPEWRTRAMLDEAVAHVLTAALVAVLTALFVLIGMNTASPGHAGLPSWASGLVAGFGAYLLLLFVMVIRKLWAAYEVANELDQGQQYLHR